MDFEKARYNMVEQQVRPWDVFNPRVLDVISDVPREHFTPDNYKNFAYTDTNVPLGRFEEHACFMAKPNIDGRILQALDIQQDDIVLEVGTGSGYLTTCLSLLARHVDTVDKYQELSALAQKNLEKFNPSLNNVNFSTGDAAEDWHQKTSYNAIAINVAVETVPPAYKKRLAIGGRLFVVTGKAPAMQAQLIVRTDEKHWTTTVLFETCIESMIKPEKMVFEF